MFLVTSAPGRSYLLCDVATFPGHSAALSVLTAAYMVQPALSWPERSGVQVAIIPARYQSSRFPGKPLALIAGKPMIQRTWDQAKSATTLTDVYVATDDDRIRETCEEFGAKVLMTSPNCPNGTARCAEAALALGSQFDLVLNIQGDEPLLEPAVIDAVVRTLQEAPQDVRALLDLLEVLACVQTQTTLCNTAEVHLYTSPLHACQHGVVTR